MAIPSLNIGGGKWATKQDKLLAYKQNTGGRYFAIDGDTSRNSTATFTNQNGLIESVGNNVARVDFQDEASEIIKAYGLKSKLKIGSGKTYGEYVPEKDLITIRPMYKSVKQFLLTVLHEIGHALDAKRLGVKKYIKKYTQAGTMATYHGLDPHDDNKWEEKAEKFARKELSKWL